METRHQASLLLAVVALGACTAGPNQDASLDELLEADRAFAAATATNGIEGWIGYFAEDGAMIQADQVVRGHGAIREAMEPLFADTSSRLTWEPEEAEVSPDRQLGYTYGPYRLVRLSDDSVLARGRYVTVWRRTDGGWKVAVDIGAASGSP